MHEVSLMQQTLQIACAQARAINADRIHTLRMRIGPLAGVVREALEFAFEALKPGTPAAEARLEIEAAPLVCYCRHCAATFERDSIDYVCPGCDGVDVDIHGGTEMELTTMEVS